METNSDIFRDYWNLRLYSYMLEVSVHYYPMLHTTQTLFLLLTRNVKMQSNFIYYFKDRASSFFHIFGLPQHMSSPY